MNYQLSYFYCGGSPELRAVDTATLLCTKPLTIKQKAELEADSSNFGKLAYDQPLPFCQNRPVLTVVKPAKGERTNEEEPNADKVIHPVPDTHDVTNSINTVPNAVTPPRKRSSRKKDSDS